MVASAASYVVSPAVFGVSPNPNRGVDRLSAAYLIALAARIVREVSGLMRRARVPASSWRPCRSIRKSVSSLPPIARRSPTNSPRRSEPLSLVTTTQPHPAAARIGS